MMEAVMANREQKGNREKRKPKKVKTKVATMHSPSSSIEAAKADQGRAKKGK
jgi:hypothetical protein